MKKLLKKILNNFKKEQEVEKDFSFNLEYPSDLSFGHYSTNYALVLAQLKKKNPKEIAEEIVVKLSAKTEFTQNFSAQIAGPGFINFRLKPTALINSLNEIAQKGADYGKSAALRNKKIMIEYAQPNPFKSFHVGHLRNVIIGASLARVLENAGAKVVKTNYQGDVGLHVAKCFYGMRQNPQTPKSLDEKVVYLADCYVKGTVAYKEDKQAKEKIQEFNRQIYAPDSPLRKEWLEKRKWSLDKFEEIFKRLGADFDKYYFESQMHEVGLKKCREGQKRGILVEDDGCLIFQGEKYGLNNRVFVNKLGLPTYEGKELGLAFNEFADFGKLDKDIHVVGNEQINFFKITFLVERLLDEKLFDDKQFHLSYGLVNLKGVKMSSRLGNIVLGEEILDAAKREIQALLKERKKGELSAQENEQIAEAVAIGAVKYSFLKIGTMKDMVFDLKESVRMDGQSGPYIMYSYVRAVNILKKAGEEKIAVENDFKDYELKPEEEKLIYCFLKLPDLARKAAINYQLAPIAEYSYELANVFSAFYDKLPVLKEQDPKARALRLALIKTFQNVQGRCLDLMGISRIEKM